MNQDLKKYRSNRFKSWLRSFFVNYIWCGVVLMLIAVLVKNNFESIYIKIVGELFMAIGIAIIVASIFSFAADTASFMDRIRVILYEIIISKDFLGNIDVSSKRDALRILVSASKEEKKLYSNIDSYYDDQIERALNISKRSIRTHYNLKASVSEKEKRIVVNYQITYRLFPSISGFDNISISFDYISEEVKSTCRYIIVAPSKGDRIKWEGDDVNLDCDNKNGQKLLSKTFDLSKRFSPEVTYLDIEISLEEIGAERWHVIPFQALLPTDGFSFQLKCDESVSITSVNTFWEGYGLNINYKTEKEISASSNKWMAAGHGIAISVASARMLSPSKSKRKEESL